MNVTVNKFIDFNYKPFGSSEEINEYLGDPDYMMNDQHPGICFGFSIQNESS